MITFVPMGDKDFTIYLQEAITTIAHEYTVAGYWQEKDAMIMARKVFNQYLPDGLNTVNQYLYTIVNENNEKVGMTWFGKVKENEVFIYDLNIDNAYQGRGYGKQTMTILEDHVRKLGGNKILLHVFGHNKIAISLYEKMGYQAYSINMSKNI